MSKLDHALALAAEGFKVFPIAPQAKAPPLLNGWPQKATSDAEEVKLYWLAVPEANIGIHCSGLLVIDVDIKKGGHESLDWIRLNEDLPATRRAGTPSGGEHWFYRLPHDHSGVPNSVSVLGPGLDIRSTGGYVVAPGSEVAAGAYAWVDATVPLVLAPAWLVERLGTPKVRTADAVVVADADAETVVRATEWLRTAERSVRGAGGDQAAFRVAARLRDFGLSYAQACDAMRSEAWDHGCGWREGRLEEKPIRSAYKYATGEAGGKAATAEEFPLIETSPPIRKPEGKLLSLAAFAGQADRSAGYVVKGLLQRKSYAEEFGAPGEGKTFVALDIAYHVAAGKPWMDRKVHQGPVLYLAFEGLGGLIARAKALRQHYGNKDVPLYIVNAAMNLREKTGRAELGDILAALPAKPVLVVIDTFARALLGGDENSAQDVGAFNAAIAALIENTGACVCIIHHSGKDKSKGARGSSALLGAIDTEIQVDGGAIISRKQRDVELAQPIGFKLTPLVVGVDEDGDPATSCVVEPAALTGPGLMRITGNVKNAFDALCSLRPNNTPVDPQEWKEACREFLPAKRLNAAFHEIKKKLIAAGYTVVDEKGMITRRSE